MRFKHFLILAVFVITASLLTACAGGLPAGVRVEDRSNNASATRSGDAGDVSVNNASGAVGSETPELADASETPEVEGTSTEDAGDTRTPAPQLTAVAQGEHEFIGTVEAINGTEWTIGGQTFLVTNATEFKNLLSVGDLAKVHVVVNADGTITIIE